MVYVYFATIAISLITLYYFKLSWRKYISLVLLAPLYPTLFLSIFTNYQDFTLSNILGAFFLIYLTSIILALPSISISAAIVLYIAKRYQPNILILTSIGSIIGALSLSYLGKHIMLYAFVSGALSILTLKYIFKERVCI